MTDEAIREPETTSDDDGVDQVERFRELETSLETAQAEVQRHVEVIAGLEQRIRELEEVVAQLEATLEARDEELAVVRGQLAMAVEKYRSLVLAEAPEVPQELVAGETIEEVDASLAQARSVVETIRRQLESRVAAERVPAGAPPRTTPDLSGLSPKEKIAYALARG